MKAILEFNLPDEKIEFEMASKGDKYLSAIHDIANMLRGHSKYNSQNLNTLAVETIYDEFYEILNSYGIDPFEI